jgi:hypothetical protein
VNKIANVLTLLILTATLSACSFIRPIEVKEEQVERLKLDLVPQPPLVLQKIDWFIITEHNMQEYINTLKGEGKHVVFFSLSEDDYETLSINLAKILKYILINNDMLNKYKQYYEGENDVSGSSNGSQ